MIIYKNIVRYDNLEFDEYLKLRGYSHSFLKSERFGQVEEFKITDKVILGKLVDAILTDPAGADMTSHLYPAAKSIAFEIRRYFGNMIERFEKQVSYSAIMSFKGNEMPTTGRLDFLLPKLAVIDLKVTSMKDVQAQIKYMGYENQLFHYAHLAQVKQRFILIYSVPLKRTQLINLGVVSQRNEFWETKIEKFGQQEAA